MELSQKIDKLTKYLCFASSYMSVVFGMTSAIIVGYISYYVSDMKEDSFALPLHVRYKYRLDSFFGVRILFEM